MHNKHQLPSIVRLKTYVKRKPYLQQQFTRFNVFRRDNFICQYCYYKFDPKNLTLDHVIPASKGGKKNWLNIVTACRKCNQKKGDKLLHECSMKLKQRPFAPKWQPNLKFGQRESNKVPPPWKDYLRSKY